MSDFMMGIERQTSGVSVSCSGELDLITCPRLREAIDIALNEGPQRVSFDGRGITLLSSVGIKVLFDLATGCRDRGIELELKLSRPARRILDLVGLWWLGVVDDGLSAEETLSDALKRFSSLPPSNVGSEYFLG